MAARDRQRRPDDPGDSSPPQTLGAFAKEETMAGKPLPQDVFKTSTMNFVSITKG